MIRLRKYSLVLLVLPALALASRAQTNRATLEGTVTDKSGGTVSGASVKITEVSTAISQERKTNSNGYYRFPGLAVGEYAVTVSNASFKTKILEHVELHVGETHTLDVPLEVGAVEEKVEITAEASPVERSSAEQATVIRTDQIANLPVNGRDWADLTLLAPFAQDDGGGDQRTIRFAGRARDDNNFSFDGVDAGGIQEQAQKSQVRLQVSEDAIAEYRVNSALYDAEYGTQAGGQIDIVTKSGSNDFHGTAFGYLRNSTFDARNFNDPPVVPPFRMGQYGLTLGGPIKKDKTFFFVSYEGLRQLQESTTIASVPTASFLRDILINGRNGSGPSPQMCSILQAFPWRSSTGTVGNCAPRFTFPDSLFSPLDNPLTGSEAGDAEKFTTAAPTIVHEDTWLVRIDHKFSDKTTLYGRAQRDISLVSAPNGNNVALDKVRTLNHPANYFLALQHFFTANLSNEAKVFINRAPFHNPQASILPYAVNSNNFVGLNNNQADIEVGTTYGVIDNLTWLHGRHTFKAGMEIRRIRLNQGKTASNTLDFTDDLSLISASLSDVKFTAPWCCHKYRRTFLLPYFQDEWKVTPTFTANLGLRWEYYGVAHEADNRTTVFDFNQFHGACLGSGSTNQPFPTPINTPACPRNPSLYNPNYLNFDPRVSVAWAPSARHGKTVIRSGFGIYHGAAQNDDLNAGLESDTFTGSVQNVQLNPAFQQTIPDFSGTTGLSLAANNPRALQRHGRRDLYVETWGLTIEQELPDNFLVSTSYLGSHGVRLFARGAVNLCITTPDVNGNCVRPLDQFYPGGDPFGSVDLKTDSGTSSYQGLLLSLERQFTNGFSFQTRYTFSHSINDGSVGGGESSGPENLNCRQCDKGPSIFDVRHNFTVNAVYELPFGPGKAYLNNAGPWGKIAGGWSFSGVGLWHTGHPLTVALNIAPSQLPDGNDQTNQRPDVVPGVPLTLPGGGRNGVPLVNAAAFQAPPFDSNGVLTRFGNAGNGIIRALDSWQVDLAAMKETKLSERFELEFGVQVFNIFNHTQLGDPSPSNPNSLALNYDPTAATTRFLTHTPDFGVITRTVNFNSNNDNAASPNTGTGLPRQLQLMLRFRF
jgi:Carboxypeptidase regulatory-like domain